jgi:hypothetical protein
MGGCTPSYFTNEGAFTSVQDTEEMTRIARTMMWGEGFESYINVLRSWKDEGSLAGLTVHDGAAQA